MIDLSNNIAIAQIAFAIGIIAFAIAWRSFTRSPKK